VTEIPEHLLKRAQAAREKAAADYDPSDPTSDPRLPRHLQDAVDAARRRNFDPFAPPPRVPDALERDLLDMFDSASYAGIQGRMTARSRIPEHLLERSRDARAAAEGNAPQQPDGTASIPELSDIILSDTRIVRAILTTVNGKAIINGDFVVQQGPIYDTGHIRIEISGVHEPAAAADRLWDGIRHKHMTSAAFVPTAPISGPRPRRKKQGFWSWLRNGSTRKG
jgi:hypothetical protein